MRKRIAWLVTTGLLASALAVPGIALAHTNEAIAETGGMTLTLPGVGLNVNVRLDDFGNLATIDVLDPAAPVPEGEEPDGAVDITDPHRMRFEIGDDGTRLAIMAKKHKLTGKVQAGALSDLIGRHEWSAVLFPEAPGGETATTVPFEVTDGPDIVVDEAGIAPLGPDVTFEVAEDGDGDDAAVSIIFTWNGYTKVLKIKVDVDEADDEDGPSAVLKVELRAKDRQRLRGNLEEFAGRDYVWNGRLCDGTAVGVDYSIDDAGVLTPGRVSGADSTVKEQERGFQVRFVGTKARLHVKFGQNDEGTWDLKVDAKATEKCKHEDQERGKKERSDRERAGDIDEAEDD